MIMAFPLTALPSISLDMPMLRNKVCLSLLVVIWFGWPVEKGRAIPPDCTQRSPRERAALTRWMQRGIPFPQYPTTAKSADTGAKDWWALKQPTDPLVPKVKDASWPQSGLDHFILAKLEAKGLRPAPPADRRTLIRRATYDLIGLPPTPDEIAAFLNDRSANAFAKVVDRLLASPHYGERWARHWLDYARYADEKFTRQDARLPNMYRYRDWVVQAFNDDMPYDLFVKAQIAADLLPVSNREKLLPGLGFYALTSAEQDDRLDVTTRTF